jgi:hypothetical protein
VTILRNINDITIVSLIRKGDLSSYEELYDNYASLLYGIIYRIIEDYRTAEKVLKIQQGKCEKDKLSYDRDKQNF